MSTDSAKKTKSSRVVVGQIERRSFMGIEARPELNWSELLERRGSELLLYARQFTGSMVDAQDVVQDGFVKFWRFWKKGDEKDAVAYLFRSVRSSAIDHIRRRNRRATREEPREELDEMAGEPGAMFESTLDNDERRRLVEQALRTLPAEQREVLVMKLWSDMTFDQIATTLKISINTVASRYRYALAALRQKLSGEELL
jgi:RNA polymerase sigma-70 factor (ECF subfamily)